MDPLSLTVGKRSIAENLSLAVAEGRLVPLEGGRWTLPASEPRANWLHSDLASPCNPAWLSFLFRGAYGSAQVPAACRTCFKVKASLGSFRQLRAAYEIAKDMGRPFKCGPEVEVPYSTDLYGLFFYLDGLDDARALRSRLRQAVDGHPHLGDAVPVTIKRGCTEYEMACGPSDRWTFDDATVQWEPQILERFVPPPSRPRPTRAAILASWIATAHRIGDPTYRDVTGGRPLYPAVVTYD